MVGGWGARVVGVAQELPRRRRTIYGSTPLKTKPNIQRRQEIRIDNQELSPLENYWGLRIRLATVNPA